MIALSRGILEAEPVDSHGCNHKTVIQPFAVQIGWHCHVWVSDVGAMGRVEITEPAGGDRAPRNGGFAEQAVIWPSATLKTPQNLAQPAVPV